MKITLIRLLVFWVIFASFNIQAAVKETELFNDFVKKMVEKHQFDADKLNTLFQSVDIKKNILKAMGRPAEGMPWYKYRKIFMTDTRIKGGGKILARK